MVGSLVECCAGFIFFSPTYLAGPAFEYKDYVYWMKVG
jgi:D-alanyl-lipoteichoic acid acyltransferase DltB (MBOAT superfamily)